MFTSSPPFVLTCVWQTTEETISKDLVKANSALQNAQKTVDTAETDITKSEKATVAASAAVDKKKAAIAQDAFDAQSTQEAAVASLSSYTALQQSYQNMCAGISEGEDASTASLPDQIAKAHEQGTSADSEIKVAGMKVEHLGKSVKALAGEMKKEEKAAAKLNEKKSLCAKKAEGLQVKKRERRATS